MKLAVGQSRAELERMVDALEQIHRGDGPASTEGALRSVIGAAAGPDRVYAEATQMFSAQERLLRSQSAAAGKLIEGLRARSTTPRQAVLRLAGSPAGSAGGRFILRNESARPARFSFRPEFGFPVRFLPANPTLPPGGSTPVDLRLELDGSFTPGEVATLLVDVFAEDRPRLKLWLDVAVESPA